MGGAVFPPCCLTWDQTMAEVMKIRVPPSKGPMHTLLHSVPWPCRGHCWPTPLPETPGHSWESLDQSLMWSLLLSPGSWCAQGYVCALQESVSPVLCKFWWLYGGVNSNLLQKGLCHTHADLLHPEPLWQATADLYLHRRHSDPSGSVSVCWVCILCLSSSEKLR